MTATSSLIFITQPPPTPRTHTQRAAIADFYCKQYPVYLRPPLNPLVAAESRACSSPIVPIFREAVKSTLTALPRVGMIVAADESDPAGALHPVHPGYKQELSRRTWLWADNVVYGNASSPASGPRVLSALWDAWQPTWGDCACANARIEYHPPNSLAHLACYSRVQSRRDRRSSKPYVSLTWHPAPSYIAHPADHYGTGAGSYICTENGPYFCGGALFLVPLPRSPAALRRG